MHVLLRHLLKAQGRALCRSLVFAMCSPANSEQTLSPQLRETAGLHQGLLPVPWPEGGWDNPTGCLTCFLSLRDHVLAVLPVGHDFIDFAWFFIAKAGG